MSKILIYVPHSTARLQYTFDWIFDNRFGLDFTITTSVNEFDESRIPKINYSNLILSHCLNINASSILFDSTINENYGEIGHWNGLTTLFKTFNEDVPFDLFGAVFYCISRMEEYGENAVDKHQRYVHTNSVLHKLNVLHLPVVDLWLEAFKNVLKTWFPDLGFKPLAYNTLNTIDIDQAFCYKGKGLQRNVGGLLRDLLMFRFAEVVKRISVLAGTLADPYDTFSYLISKQSEYKIKSVAFFLLADYGEYDKNLSHTQPDFIQRIQSMKGAFDIGVHPSYFSCEKASLLTTEMERLQNIAREHVIQSRQHFLRFKTPDTFRRLLDAGIRHEYSMGYPETTGFRAGTAYPFHWFDIEKNEVTVLEIIPCCAMDVTFKNYLHLSPQESIQKLLEIKNQIRTTGGNFVCIWHNESVSDYAEWKGWKAVYESTIRD